jgi:hypothetical protein
MNMTALKSASAFQSNMFSDVGAVSAM